MGKKDLENISLNINTENENLDFSEFGNTKTNNNKLTHDEGREKICKQITLYIDYKLFIKFKTHATANQEKPNRLFEEYMKDYINKNK